MNIHVGFLKNNMQNFTYVVIKARCVGDISLIRAGYVPLKQ